MAGLSVKQISSFLNIAPVTTRNMIRRNCRVFYTENGGQRVTIEEFIRFLLDRPQYLERFKHNYELQQIDPPYQFSADIVYNRIKEIKEALLSEEIDLIATSDILSLPFYTGFKSTQEISNLCKRNEITGFKTKKSKGCKWRIPVASFAIYIKMHTDIENSFYASWRLYEDRLKRNDLRRYKIMRSIHNALGDIQNYDSETLAVQEVMDILNIPRNQVETVFCTDIPWARKIRFAKAIPAMNMAKYLHANPDVLERTWSRWWNLKTENVPLSSRILHVLMIYEWYKRCQIDYFAKTTSTIIEEKS